MQKTTGSNCDPRLKLVDASCEDKENGYQESSNVVECWKSFFEDSLKT